MSANTKIEWADHTFNPWIGCMKVGPGCDHCYAAAWDSRFAVSGHAERWGAGAERTRTGAANWKLPLRWNNVAAAGNFVQCPACAWRGDWRQADRRHGCCPRCGHLPPRFVQARPRVFCASLADVFDTEVPDAWRMDLFKLIADTPHLDWLLLTKRIGNVGRYLQTDGMAFDLMTSRIWLGATVCNQAEADRDIPKLLRVPAAKRFLSIEPMLGPIDLQRACLLACGNKGCCFPIAGTMNERGVVDSCEGGITVECICSRLNRIDWVICGGESGPNARPMHPDWPRSLRDQCAAAGVPFFFKQWGEWSPGYAEHGNDLGYDAICTAHQHEWPEGHSSFRVGKKAAGRLLDGREWNEVPA